MAIEAWQDKALKAQEARDASLAKVEPPLKGLPIEAELPLNSRNLPREVLTEREIEITEKPVSELLAVLRERRISVEEVTRAFLRRAAVAQVATNCLTSLLWTSAISRAKHLDSLPEPKGALFGLPISTKEHHGMVGENVLSNASYVSWIDKPHGSNVLYDTLWDEGCVFFARTTQPQTIMHLETNSNVYGRTVNPYNRLLTPGGSSGGEAALIGMRGSVLGIGGDIGGSIRCPAAHCGIYGLKPTTQRISLAGSRSHCAGKETILATCGPMATERDSLSLLMQVALSSKPWRIDPGLTNKPWTPYTLPTDRPLKIAVQWWDGVVRPHPPMIRALKEVSEACKKAGMDVVEWDCTGLDHKKAWEITAALYWPDGGEEVLGLLEESGEPVLPLTEFIISEQKSVRKRDMHELWKLCAERDAYRAFYANAWNRTASDGNQEVDVILCPPSFGAATPHDQSRYWGYTAQWNLLDYPGVVFPVTSVDPVKDGKVEGYEPVNEEDRVVYEMYSPERYRDAPVSLQIVGRRGCDEMVLAALEVVERAMGRA
ncbi:Acetamidase [Aspergillus mulundensis]|uniref:amidase n=1 Tax=Aspergillus mulundensis TaxID=1810919 RepID=A0A3D8RRG5_9EURO|nr:Acetamidase [Aspergillus mulundensis]RDW76672.1 Acetamidase [Aspergillus mulundensis]